MYKTTLNDAGATAGGDSRSYAVFVEQPADVSEKLKFKPKEIPEGSYGITAEELNDIVDFDNRTEKSQIQLLNSKEYGGVEGLAYLLKTNVKAGLRCRKDGGGAQKKWQSEASLVAQKNKKWFWQLDKTDEAYHMGSLRGNVIDSAIRVEWFGRNYIEPPKPESILSMIFTLIKEDLVLQILLVASIVALVVGMITEHGWLDSVVIFVAVFIVSTVTAINNFQNEKKFKKLLLIQSSIRCKVLRNKQLEEISSWDLLAGDIVSLYTGDEIPADGLYIRGENMVVDESPLTGESKPVKKNADVVFLFAGCQVSEGSGFMLVTSLGKNSTSGKIQKMLAGQQSTATPLQNRLGTLAKQIGIVGLISSVLTLVALLINWGIDFSAKSAAGNIDGLEELLSVLRFIVVSITVLVVAIPEGLPISVTISLGFSMFEMMKEMCFVRQLQSSETMGGATCICTDKTGTLTENRMRVVKIIVGDRVYCGEGSGEPNAKEFHNQTLPTEVSDILAENICINSTCFLKYTQGNALPTFVGSATEGAILVFMQNLGIEYQNVRDIVDKVENGTTAFDSKTKIMSTMVYPCVVIPTESAFTYIMHVKGAPEVILNNCSHYMNRNGIAISPMAADDIEKYRNIQKKWASEGLRTLALAFKGTNVHIKDEPEDSNIHANLILLGLVGIKDPVRKEVPNAVEECQQAGLAVRMVTGDNLLTASKIAKECNILKAGDISIEGRKFREMDKASKIKLLPHLKVLARSSPLDKYELVKLLKECGEVVAVTGDGTNDAPALKEADVGFAMGISGTQVAVNASDIVLLDDNFKSIVAAIRWGRNVIQSVRKFLQFQLSVNFCAVLITIISSAIGGYPAVNPASLLWINLIMDSLGALSLASDKPAKNILSWKPNKRSDGKILTGMMQTYIVIQTVFQVCILTLIQYYIPMDMLAPEIAGDVELIRKHTSTVIVTTFVLLQVGNLITTRQLQHEVNIFQGLFSNYIFLLIQVLIIGTQILIVEVGYDLFGFQPMNIYEWAFSVLMVVLLLFYVISIRVLIKGISLHRYKGKAKIVDVENT